MRELKLRRRFENKTDYKARLALLKSGLPRIVVRKTNKYVITQIIGSKEAQDFVICSVNSKELKKYGWNLSLKNIPASYLTGFLLGTIAKKNKVEKAILDLGLQRSTKGSKIYAVLKGCIDAGIDVTCSKDILPSEDRIKGKHLTKNSGVEELENKIKESIKSKK